MRKLHPSLIDFSLGRILGLLEKMGSPHKKLPPVIHIAGTNGKGSTLAFIRSICEYSGLRVQCFVSPHLVSFHERIQLPGPVQDRRCFPIPEERLVEVLEDTEKANNDANITFFEITAAAAFLAFARNKADPGYGADILILETGLGGRLDATNIIDRPALSVITPIALDHMHYLGDTLEKIAGEKAGIIKQGVPCIAAHQDHEVLHVLAEHCLKKESPLIAAGREWDCYREHDRMVFQSDSPLLASGSGVLDLPLPGLAGPHQIRNAGTAIAAVLALKQFTFKTDAIASGLKGVHWPGRMQRLKAEDFETCHPQSEVWLDGGHNPAAGAVLAQYMADLEERVPSPLFLICGMMDKKDPKNFLACFKGLASYTITVPVPGSNPENPHGYNPEQLAEQAQDIGMPAIAAGSISIAMSHIRTQAENRPVRILITGSLYLAGDVLRKIGVPINKG